MSQSCVHTFQIRLTRARSGVGIAPERLPAREPGGETLGSRRGESLSGTNPYSTLTFLPLQASAERLWALSEELIGQTFA